MPFCWNVHNFSTENGFFVVWSYLLFCWLSFFTHKLKFIFDLCTHTMWYIGFNKRIYCTHSILDLLYAHTNIFTRINAVERHRIQCYVKLHKMEYEPNQTTSWRKGKNARKNSWTKKGVTNSSILLHFLLLYCKIVFGFPLSRFACIFSVSKNVF